MRSLLDVATESWGIKVERVEIKDARLPVQLQVCIGQYNIVNCEWMSVKKKRFFLVLNWIPHIIKFLIDFLHNFQPLSRALIIYQTNADHTIGSINCWSGSLF